MRDFQFGSTSSNARPDPVNLRIALSSTVRYVLCNKSKFSAVGIPKFIKSEWIKDNSVVIDAGYHPQKCGDIDLEGVISRSSAYTPVPGGVGPMTINTLILNTLLAAQKEK